MKEDKKPLENQVGFDDLIDVLNKGEDFDKTIQNAPHTPLEPLDGVDVLTPKKPDDLLTDYTNIAKDTSSILEEIEKFKKQHEEVFNEYQKLLDKITDNETKQSLLKEDLVTSMESANIASIGNDMFKVAFIAATTRNTFDSARFKKEHQDLYKDYVKVSNVKAYVKITENV